MRRFDHRAIPSASLINRSLDATAKLFTFQCGAWGNSYSSAAIYHAVSGGLGHIEGDVYDTPSGWSTAGIEPVFTAGYNTVVAAYQKASVLRTLNDPPWPSVSGEDFLLRRSPLKDPAAIPSGAPAPAGYLYGDKLLAEDDTQELVTTTPTDPITGKQGNWPYPGGKSADGVSWFADNPNVSLDSPYWQYPARAELGYLWAPVDSPGGATPQIWGGCKRMPGGVFEYGAGIVAPAGHIGLPLELQIGALPTIVSAKCEIILTDAAYSRKVWEQADAASDPTLTETTTGITMGVVLLAGKTRSGWTKWEVVEAQSGGTYTDGKTSVVDCTAIIQAMVSLAASDYDSSVCCHPPPRHGLATSPTTTAAGWKICCNPNLFSRGMAPPENGTFRAANIGR
jgi:hypothetical protein